MRNIEQHLKLLVLAVDDDRTCLFIMKACLKKWNYQVTIVKNANEALSMLGNKSFDLVLTDVHMPDMNGFELQRCIIQEFSLPVILISADTRAEVMCNGLKNGAQRFLVKPVMADDLKDIWQFAKWWKRTKNIISAPPSQISGSSQESVTMVDSHNGKNTRLVWTWDLHSRFVEAILLIGYHRAVPTNILEVMNVEGLTRRHVASHLQKYQRFLQSVLDGKKRIEFSRWIDPDYHSRFASGNPDLILLKQLINGKQKRTLASDNLLRPTKHENTRTPNGSKSSFGRLPPFTIGDGSSSRSNNATLMQINDSSTNVASRVLGNATLPKAQNEYMGSLIRNNTSNLIKNLSYTTNQMDYSDQNTLADENDNNTGNSGAHGGANNIMFSSTNNVTPSSFSHFWENFQSKQSINVGDKNSNYIFYGNNINTDQLTQEMDGEKKTDGSWFDNIGREDEKDCWFDIEIDEDEDYNPKKEF
nr:PREDICTED: two-component response regulator ORR25-like isoform X2 [Daucus carota subsp. sativus]